MVSNQNYLFPISIGKKIYYFFILFIIFIACLYALPNFFREYPSLQISPKEGKIMSIKNIQRIMSTLKKCKISYKKILYSHYILEIVFTNTNLQIQAKKLIKNFLKNNYSVAIHMYSDIPYWLKIFHAHPIKYGLDLRGGVYFLIDINTNVVIKNYLTREIEKLEKNLYNENIYFKHMEINNNKIIIESDNIKSIDRIKKLISHKFPNLLFNQNFFQEKNKIQLVVSPNILLMISKSAIDQTIEVMRNRVDELGVSEASVSKEGNTKIAIEIPGLQDAVQAKEVIGGTSSIKFMLVDNNAILSESPKRSIYYFLSPIGEKSFFVLKNQIVLNGKSIIDAQVNYSEDNNLPVVNIRISGEEVSKFSDITEKNIGKQMAIVLIHNNFNKSKFDTDERIISIATIQQKLGDSFQISGLNNIREARILALNIRSGSLPAPIKIVQSKQIGPSLGIENIRMGKISIYISMLLITIFMVIYYHAFGIIANISLLLNLIFIIAIMSIIPNTTLTLSGLAGIVLNIGMNIDSNVLIFERIREEINKGNFLQKAIHIGYQRTNITIIDSNLTTLIVSFILFTIGTGSIKGFSITIMIGILSSMFTVLIVTRILINYFVSKKMILRYLSIGI